MSQGLMSREHPSSEPGAAPPTGRSDASRRRLRRILLIAFVPFAIAGMILSAKLFGLSPTAQSVIRSYDLGSFDRSVQQAEAMQSWNWFEPWIAYFDRGTAYAANGYYNEAVEDLEKAFDQAPADKRCDVAVNLSLSWELLGDSYVEQGLFAGAQKLYDTARAVIDAAGPECQGPDAPKNEEEGRAAGQELSDAAERLAEKSDRSGAFQGDTGDPAAPADTQDQLDRLGQQDQDAADEKAEQQGQERGEDSQGGYTDKPW